MTIKKCLDDAVNQGLLTAKEAKEALNYVNLLIASRPGMSQGAAAAAAARQLQQNAALRQQQVARQVIKAKELDAAAASHPDGYEYGVAALFSRDMTGKARYENLEARIRGVRAELHARFAGGLDAYRSTHLGLKRDVLGLRNFVRELYGETTNDPVARAAAKAWNDAADYGMTRFNMAGGNIKRLATWRLPQEWDPTLVQRAGQAEFTKFMDDAVKAGELKIVDWQTGQPLLPHEQAAIIAEAFDTIRTNGLNKVVPGQRTAAKLANARQERRAFEWTSAAAWFKFNDRFGKGDAGIFELVVSHLDGMARDIAMLEHLGPNPAAMSRTLIDKAAQKAAMAGRGAAEYRAHLLESLYNHVTGTTSDPVNSVVGAVGRGVRQWLTAAHLGSAMLSAPSDYATVYSTAAWNGLSFTGIMGRYLSLMNPANAADRLLAVRAGIIADTWVSRTNGLSRFMVEEVGNSLPARVADTVLRASMLSAHTQNLRFAVGLEFLGHLADQAGKALKDLDPRIQREFARHGIDAKTWDIIRAAPMLNHNGVKFVWAEQIARSGGAAHHDAATRLLALVNSETRMAVIEHDAIDRLVAAGATRAGTVHGELLRSMMLFKSFPISVLTRHAMRGIEAIRGGDHGRYMVAAAVGMTLIGALSMQLKQIAGGKDPRDMTDWRFWGAAFVQGGGAGIMGDFLNAGLNRADQSFMGALLGGPVWSLGDSAARLTLGNIQRSTDPLRDQHFGRDMAKFVRDYTPGTTLWYARLALDRMLWDRLQQMADPNWHRHARKLHEKARKEYDQRYFWGPGQEPRMPNLGAAIGGGPPP